MKIGFIGLGLMGSRMATRLADAGYSLTIWNRTARKTGLLEPGKAKIAESPADVAHTAHVIITMLSTPDAVQEVALGEYGILSSMNQGSVWIDCSTVNPSFSRQMAQLTEGMGFNFLDAPVAGSVGPAERGELIFFIGGKKTIVKYCAPLFKIMGSKYFHLGNAGLGSAFKLVNNLVMSLSMYAFTEGLILGESLGIEKDKIFTILENSPVCPPMAALKRNKLTSEDYSPEFPLQWLRKDLQLAAQTAYEQGIALPGTNAIKEVFALAERAGFGALDFTAIYSFMSQLNKNHGTA